MRSKSSMRLKYNVLVCYLTGKSPNSPPPFSNKSSKGGKNEELRDKMPLGPLRRMA